MALSADDARARPCAGRLPEYISQEISTVFTAAPQFLYLALATGTTDRGNIIVWGLEAGFSSWQAEALAKLVEKGISLVGKGRSADKEASVCRARLEANGIVASMAMAARGLDTPLVCAASGDDGERYVLVAGPSGHVVLTENEIAADSDTAIRAAVETVCAVPET